MIMVSTPQKYNKSSKRSDIFNIENLTPSYSRSLSNLSIKTEGSKISKWAKILYSPLTNSKDLEFASKELTITIDRIHELTELDEEDEDGEVVIPTEYAIQKASELVSEASRIRPSRFFKAWVSSEDTGGIRLTWSKPELKKQVRLVIPPTSSQQIYLYHEQNDEYGVEYNISAKTLSNQLRRLNSKK
jgi:glutamyl/glutaminyl-tRNA synthetase